MTAPLLHTQKSRVVLACQAILTSLPPAGCSGVRVKGYDFSRLRHVTRSGNAWWTGPLVLVSNEVGDGVVPTTESGRRFRDELGTLNARLAAVCDEVWHVTAGIPVRLA